MFKQSSPLTGEDLLKKIKELGKKKSKEEKAKACGYYTITKNGNKRANVMAFLNAVLDAEGIDINGGRNKKNTDFGPGSGRPGGNPDLPNLPSTYKCAPGVKIPRNGILNIGVEEILKEQLKGIDRDKLRKALVDVAISEGKELPSEITEYYKNI